MKGVFVAFQITQTEKKNHIIENKYYNKLAHHLKICAEGIIFRPY